MVVQKRILHGARVFAPGRDLPSPAAVGISGNRISWVGELDEVRGVAGPGAEEIDMEGAFIAPGFVDGHCHLLGYGQQLSALDFSDCRSIEHMRRAVAQRAAELGEGVWITGRGWDQDRLAEGRYPRSEDLDEVAPRNPVLLRRACGHAAVANSLALDEAGVDRDYPDSSSGYLERDADGNPIGVLHERAMGPVMEVIPPPDDAQRAEYLRAAIQRCHRSGLTSVQTNEGAMDAASVLSLFRRVCWEQDTAFRAYLDLPYDLLDGLLEMGVTTGSGDARVRMGAIKIFADGSLGARSAALSGEYADDPGNRGVMVTPGDELLEQVCRVHSEGMQVAVHVIGDRALDCTLDALEQAGRDWPRSDARHRMIHCQIMRAEQYSRMFRLGCVAAVQPKFVTTDMWWAESRVGERLARTSYSWRRMLDEGLVCAAGSDAPVEPIEPLLGVWAAVCRTDMDGHPEEGWMPDQKVTVGQALDMFTHGAAFAEFAETDKGIIERGALADLVVLDKDPRDVPPEEIRRLNVLETWVDGRPVCSSR